MKISNPRMLAGNAPLATQAYVNTTSAALSHDLNTTITNVSENLNTTITTVSGNLSASISAVSTYVTENYLTSHELLDKNNQINAKYLPPISITSVQTVELSAVLNTVQTDYTNNPKKYLDIYFQGQESLIQEGDVVIVVAGDEKAPLTGMNAQLLGPWIASAPIIDITDEVYTGDDDTGDGLSGDVSFTKLIFPTTDVNSVNNIVPDHTGNIELCLSNLYDYETSKLSALYQVAYDEDTKRLGSYLYDPTSDKDNKQYYATIDELYQVSGSISGSINTISSTLNTVSGHLNTTIDNVDTVSGNLDKIYNSLSAGVFYTFYTDSITFDSKSPSTVSSAILGTTIKITRSQPQNAAELAFDSALKEYLYSFNFDNELPLPEIVAIYSVDKTEKQENFYPDVSIKNNIYTISVFVMNEDELPQKIKVVYSNYKTVKKIM